jgi:hypothetical protein
MYRSVRSQRGRKQHGDDDGGDEAHGYCLGRPFDSER